jgi:hypothetical protein
MTRRDYLEVTPVEGSDFVQVKSFSQGYYARVDDLTGSPGRGVQLAENPRRAGRPRDDRADRA